MQSNTSGTPSTNASPTASNPAGANSSAVSASPSSSSASALSSLGAGWAQYDNAGKDTSTATAASDDINAPKSQSNGTSPEKPASEQDPRMAPAAEKGDREAAAENYQKGLPGAAGTVLESKASIGEAEKYRGLASATARSGVRALGDDPNDLKSAPAGQSNDGEEKSPTDQSPATNHKVAKKGSEDDLRHYQGIDLKEYLPGGARDPNRRTAGANASRADIHGRGDSIWSVVSKRYQTHCRMQLLYGCK